MSEFKPTCFKCGEQYRPDINSDAGGPCPKCEVAYDAIIGGATRNGPDGRPKVVDVTFKSEKETRFSIDGGNIHHHSEFNPLDGIQGFTTDAKEYAEKVKRLRRRERARIVARAIGVIMVAVSVGLLLIDLILS